jgi:hypothetical protein
VVFQKKVCHGSTLYTGGGGLPNPTESTMWGMQLVREELGNRHTARSEAGQQALVEGVPTGSWGIGGGNGEMDEGSEGRSGVTLGGSTTLCGENSGQSPRYVARRVPPALPRERQCNRGTLFFEILLPRLSTLNG